jgi:hypothetical protein
LEAGVAFLEAVAALAVGFLEAVAVAAVAVGLGAAACKANNFMRRRRGKGDHAAPSR